ncbi:hypothetical protein EON65_17685 [archaeon]|nr:MAG: hypothetical protein EON65_17685 [archaeon]
MSMIITGKPSSSETLTHLQLQNVNDLSTLIPSVQPNDSSDNDTKSNSLEVHEFIKADGEILCACTSSRFTLVHLTKYLNLTKYFSNTTVFYRKAEYKYDDKEAYSHYLALFKAGRMLISSTTYKEMWTEGDEGPKKKSLDALLKNNVERYLVRDICL